MTKKEIFIAIIKAAETASLATIILLVIYSFFADMPDEILIFLVIITGAFFLFQFVHKRLVKS